MVVINVVVLVVLVVVVVVVMAVEVFVVVVVLLVVVVVVVVMLQHWIGNNVIEQYSLKIGKVTTVMQRRMPTICLTVQTGILSWYPNAVAVCMIHQYHDARYV